MFQKLLRGFGMLFFWINAVLLTLWNCHWRSYEISSLCLFICVEFFSKVVHRKLLKRWGSWVFGKKLIHGCFDQMDPKLLQNQVFNVSWKIDAWNFSNFWHGITATKSLKINLGDNFRKILFWVLWAIRGQDGPKMGFSSFLKT